MSIEASRVGLKLHMSKTKILSNMNPRRGVLTQSSVKISGQEVVALRHSESTMYLGRQICFNDFHDTEIRHLLNRGWAAFGKHGAALCGRHYPLRSRLRLFVAVVTATVLYGSGTRTMTVERERLLSTTYRKMLRKMIGTPRRYLKNNADDVDEEPWVEWIIRATAIAETQMDKLGFTSWVLAQRAHKQNL